MPVVPVEPNRVGIVDINREKLAAADTRGTGLEVVGRGLEQVGAAGSQYAQRQDDLHALFDEAAAKSLDLQASQALNGILYEGEGAYYNQQGFNALHARPDVDKRLNKLRNDLMLQTKGERQKRMFLGVFDRRLEAERGSMAQFASKQVFAEAKAQSVARQQSYAQDARRFGNDPERRDMALATGIGEIETQGAHEGWSSARLATEKSAYTSDVYGGIVEDKMIVDARDAAAFLNEHAGSITPDREAVLRRGLHGPLREQQAFDDVAYLRGGAPTQSAPGEFDARDTAPLSSTATIASKIIGVESGGSSSAQNSRSSASGLGQFTRDTFVNLYTQKFGAGDKSLDQIWALRFDAKLGRKMTEMLVTQNADMLRTAGAPVTDTTLYLAHFLGPRAATGLKADPQSPIAKLVPASFIASNPSILGGGKTAGDVVEWADRKMGGAGVRPTYAPRREDIGALYAQIDARTDWTFDRKQAARDEVERVVSRQDALVARGEKDAERAALDMVTGLGSGFTSMSQLGGLTTRLSPEARRNLTELARQNAAPKAIPANGDAIIGLHQLAQLDPDAFKSTDLRLYRKAMTPAEYDQIATFQAQVQAKPNSPAAVSHSRIWQQIGFYGRDIGVDMGAKGKNESDDAFKARRKDGMALFTVMQNYLTTLTGNQRQPTDDEVKRAFDNAVMPRAAADGTVAPRYRDTSLPTNSVAIPQSVHDSIAARLKAAGLPYDNQSVARVYMQGR